jgi:hypothetical protein
MDALVRELAQLRVLGVSPEMVFAAQHANV